MGKPLTRSTSQLLPKPTSSCISQSPTTSSQIPFRPRKVRKLVTNTSASNSKTTTVSVKPLIKTDPSPVPSITSKPLSLKGEIDLALHHLRISDPILATIIDAHSPPTYEAGRSVFLSLSRSILYQQLATGAASTIYARFLTLCGGESRVLPSTVLSLSAQQLREIGVSGRKASYLHDLADKFEDGALSEEKVVEMSDDMLLTALTAVKGIGVWTVHMFMMFNLHRADVLPVGDLGVRKGVQSLYGLKKLPDGKEMEGICEKWKPYRSVGAWYMWRLMDAKTTLAREAKKIEKDKMK